MVVPFQCSPKTSKQPLKSTKAVITTTSILQHDSKEQDNHYFKYPENGKISWERKCHLHHQPQHQRGALNQGQAHRGLHQITAIRSIECLGRTMSEL